MRSMTASLGSARSGFVPLVVAVTVDDLRRGGGAHGDDGIGGTGAPSLSSGGMADSVSAFEPLCSPVARRLDRENKRPIFASAVDDEM